MANDITAALEAHAAAVAKTKADYAAHAIQPGYSPQNTASPAPPNLIIIGAGGHGRMLMEALRGVNQRIAGFVDVNPTLHGTRISDTPVATTIEAIAQLYGQNPANMRLINGVGNSPQVGDSQLAMRAEVYTQFKFDGYMFEPVISRDACVMHDADWDEGVQVLGRSFIGPGCRIQANVVVNSCAQLDHDAVVGAHSHIAPGAVICGNVTLGNCVHVGAGAVVIQGITIGNGAVIGAGAVVTEDVPDYATVLPARSTVRLREPLAPSA